MLEEKLKEAIVAELKRQAANDPQSLRIENSDGLVVDGKIDLDDLAMVIAPLQAGYEAFRGKRAFRGQRDIGTEIAAGCSLKNGWT
jgi:hypothetical protein